MNKDKTNFNVPNNDESSDMDGLIKLIIAIILASMPFHFKEPMSFGILSIYLLAVTVVLRIKLKTLLISAISYCIIVLIPYLFGLMINSLIYSFTNSELFAYFQGYYEIFIRPFRLSIIWYVSILYFHTTPVKTVIGLLEKLLFPLKLVGIPVKDYLKVVMCIVQELKGTGAEIKKSFIENARSTNEGTKRMFRINVKGLSQIIVSLLVNSFEKLDQVQSFFERVNAEDLYSYKFNVSKRDIIGVLSLILLASLIAMIERGYWLS